MSIKHIELQEGFAVKDWLHHGGFMTPNGDKYGGACDLVANKINEMVDAINSLQNQVNNHMCRLVVLEHPEDNEKLPEVDDLPEVKLYRSADGFTTDNESELITHNNHVILQLQNQLNTALDGLDKIASNGCLDASLIAYQTLQEVNKLGSEPKLNLGKKKGRKK